MRVSAKREFVHRDLGGQLDALRGDIDAKKETIRRQMERGWLTSRRWRKSNC
ncbi:MAG: hypothetical protein IPM07_30200 [Anaerolineales bacterium]|nr:hypothetical protein [Anaerolineales bacterium]